MDHTAKLQLRDSAVRQRFFYFFVFREQSAFKSNTASSSCKARSRVRLDQSAEPQPSVLGATALSARGMQKQESLLSKAGKGDCGFLVDVRTRAQSPGIHRPLSAPPSQARCVQALDRSYSPSLHQICINCPFSEENWMVGRDKDVRRFDCG